MMENKGNLVITLINIQATRTTFVHSHHVHFIDQGFNMMVLPQLLYLLVQGG